MKQAQVPWQHAASPSSDANLCAPTGPPARTPCRLRAVQKEAVQVIAELRSKMIAAPGSGAGELEASGAGAKRRKAVAFQQPRRGGVA